MTSYLRALDTFVIELDGVPRGVQKGAILPESDPVVQHDLANGGVNFTPLDTGEDEKPAPAKSGPAKAEPAAEKAAAVKDSPKAAAAPRPVKGGA